MDINDIKNKLSEKLSGLDRRKLIVFLGIAGMLLILISELIPDKSEKTEQSLTTQNDDTDSEQYKQQLENELDSILSDIDGVGETSIMITLDGTTEYIYAEELDTTTDNNDGKKRESYRSNIVMTENGGDKKALIKKVIRPQVTGVLIACTGGDDILTKEKVIGAVSAVLGIPAGRVYVVKLSD